MRFPRGGDYLPANQKKKVETENAQVLLEDVLKSGFVVDG